MPTKRAKTIEPEQFRGLLAYVDAHSAAPECDRLKLVLSYYAGLRVSEIAKMPVDAVLTPSGQIAKTITVFSNVAKKGNQRSIPMHPEIARALREFLRVYPDATHLAISTIGRYQSVSTVTVWFHQLYKKVGLTGCSSHSGRRTYLTQLARRASQAGCSLRDVQELAGHARLDTTAAYLDPSPHVAQLVMTLGDPRFDDMDSGTFSDRALHPEIARKLSSPRTKRRAKKPKVADLPVTKVARRPRRGQ